MNNNIKITYPSSDKVYMPGKLYPDLRVGMRRVRLTPTIDIVDGNKKVMTDNPPVYIYDTSGAYSDPNVEIDLTRGCPSCASRGLTPVKRAKRRWHWPSAV